MAVYDVANQRKPVVRFFIHLFIICSCWFFVYALILAPGRIIDRPLTHFLSASSAKLITLLSPSGIPETSWAVNAASNGAILVQNNQRVFGIMDVCNGLDLMFIYSAVIILLPNSMRRKLVFLLFGNILLVLANILRIVSLYFIFRYSRGIFDFSHHYLFTLLMYVFIFAGWLFFIKNRLNAKAG